MRNPIFLIFLIVFIVHLGAASAQTASHADAVCELLEEMHMREATIENMRMEEKRTSSELALREFGSMTRSQFCNGMVPRLVDHISEAQARVFLKLMRSDKNKKKRAPGSQFRPGGKEGEKFFEMSEVALFELMKETMIGPMEALSARSEKYREEAISKMTAQLEAGEHITLPRLMLIGSTEYDGANQLRVQYEFELLSDIQKWQVTINKLGYADIDFESLVDMGKIDLIYANLAQFEAEKNRHLEVVSTSQVRYLNNMDALIRKLARQRNQKPSEIPEKENPDLSYMVAFQEMFTATRNLVDFAWRRKGTISLTKEKTLVLANDADVAEFNRLQAKLVESHEKLSNL